jgi:hypothetical protein
MSKPDTLTVKAARSEQPVPRHDFARQVDRAASRAKCEALGIRLEDARACHLVFRDMIYDDPVEVPNVRYYRRRIVAGDLVEAPLEVSKVRTRKAKEE